jgi:hypothetical protein
MPEELYIAVVKVTEDYLGPSADRFIARQIEFHLNKKPEDLTKKDLRNLVQWVKVSIGLLTEDRKMVDSCSDRIAKLAA